MYCPKSHRLVLGALMAVSLVLGACATGSGPGGAKAEKRTVVVWSEGTAPKRVYPNDINGAIAEGLTKSLKGWNVVTASINDPEQGLPDDLLNKADVLIWWGHKKHDLVNDALVAKIVKRVKEDGMGFISLHSAHYAKPNKALMGTECSWGAYETDTKTMQILVKDANHPIAKGVKDFTIKNSERYSDPYAVPTPESVVFDGIHELRKGGSLTSQVGLCWTVGKGNFFYFQAGHETNPIYYDENVRKIMTNAVEWAAPAK